MEKKIGVSTVARKWHARTTKCGVCGVSWRFVEKKPKHKHTGKQISQVQEEGRGEERRVLLFRHLRWVLLF